MRRFDQSDLLGGLLMAGVGAFAAIYAGRYDFGTLRQMGPGFYPVVVGWVLTGMGGLLSVQSLLRHAPPLRFSVGPPLLVIGVVTLFGLMLDQLGLVITLPVCAFLLTYLTGSLSVLHRFITAAVMTGLSLLIFIAGLGMLMPLWP